MRRPKTAPAAAAMPPARVIDPNGVFLAGEFRELFGLRASTLRREVKSGRLRVARRGGKYLILGSWILDWVREGELRPAAERSNATELEGVEG